MTSAHPDNPDQGTPSRPAQEALKRADSIDPGLKSALILSKRDQLLADHYTAYGMRTALTLLGHDLEELRRGVVG